MGNPEGLSSGFPCVKVGGQQHGVELGYLHYAGMMVGDTTAWIGRYMSQI